MEARRWEKDRKAWKRVRRGWALGSEEFRKELLARMRTPVGRSHYGAELRESDEQKAHGLIAEELKGMKSSKIDWAGLRKGDARKVKIARRLRRETSVPVRWIVEELKMGSVAYASRLIAVRRNE